MTELDPARRAALAREVLAALTAHCPGSGAQLRGSLARGTADAYSDIDLVWTVPDERFGACVAAVPDVLATVREVRSVRTDPDLARSRKRRLLFADFEDLPIFWRLDLEIVAASVAGRPGYDDDNPAARGEDRWRAAGALANAVAAAKAVLRGQPQTARGLLERGFVRIGAVPTVAEDWSADVGRLAEAAAAAEPDVAAIADRVTALALALPPRSAFAPPKAPAPPGSTCPGGGTAAVERRSGAMMDGCDSKRSPGNG
ncbi:nucleotidyltransferase domain-containing protein [Streptomyces sp. A0958]|uniref:nucleotidyltransferase domain-containing protein n=1 Tax=Streptomyces sp. A0958 TaxID=2563101 RepID=UPI0019CF51A3|nr:nucleotidyltransferase domain-containing protein [Streptomyces sp. A0958]